MPAKVSAPKPFIRNFVPFRHVRKFSLENENCALRQLILTHSNFIHNVASSFIWYFEMAGLVGRSVSVDFIGCNAEHLSQEIKDAL